MYALHWMYFLTSHGVNVYSILCDKHDKQADGDENGLVGGIFKVLFTLSSSIPNWKTWDTLNVNDASLLSARPRWPPSPSEIQISLKALAFGEEFSSPTLPPANFKSTEMRETGWGLVVERGMKRQREGERRGGGGRFFVRDTARTSPRSHMVVEMVLYGCVCLSVPFRIFTGKRRRPAVCNNISPSLPSFFSLPSTISLSLCFCLFVSAAILEICSRLSLWLMANVDSRWEWVI